LRSLASRPALALLVVLAPLAAHPAGAAPAGAAPASAAPVRAAAPARAAAPVRAATLARAAAPDADAPARPAPRALPGLAPRPVPAPDAPQAPLEPGERRAWLRANIDMLLAQPELKKTKAGVLVVEADTGTPIYSHAEKTPLNAASNVKLVTSAAALSLLGPEYRWRTTLSVAGAPGGASVPPGGELAGDLVLRGGGDPTLSDEDLAAMVADLTALGVRKVRGALVVDDSFFDRATVGPAYDQKNESIASRAPSSAASLDGNAVAVTVIPGAAAGAPARITLEPASPYFVVAGSVITASDGPAAPSVETRDEGGARTRITVSGRIRFGDEPRTLYRRVVHPALFLGATLRQQLERRGIIVEKPTRVAAVAAQGLRVLSTHESAPLAVVVQELNKLSINFMAEQVLRTLGAEIVGRPGTWDKGLEAVARYLASLGLPRGSYQMTNGSGLYDSNHFSAEQIVDVLRAASRDFRISAEFLASLAVAGTDGTIAHRMAGTLAERYVRAKTGTLATVSCLSGFAGSPGRMPLVFSILMNDVANTAEARRTQDRVAELLVAYLEAGAAPQP
jgi:serine-type D-Ala-D-Ala carboxypeptidase/endopeptidase (penicillin-binding protein 4)